MTQPDTPLGDARIVERLHGLIELLAGRFRGYLPWPSELRDSVVRGHEAAIDDTIKCADELVEQFRAMQSEIGFRENAAARDASVPSGATGKAGDRPLSPAPTAPSDDKNYADTPRTNAVVARRPAQGLDPWPALVDHARQLERELLVVQLKLLQAALAKAPQSAIAPSEDHRQAIVALSGLYGLLQLYAARDDMPADFARWVLNHRAVEARRVLACFEQNTADSGSAARTKG